MKYKKKPVEIEAVQWMGYNDEEIFAFCPEALFDCAAPHEVPELYIKTLEGNLHASEGDYIIQGVHGEYYPCKPDIFEETYDPVEG